MKHTREVSMVLRRLCAAEDCPRDLLSLMIETSKLGKGAAQFDEILIDITNKTLSVWIACAAHANWFDDTVTRLSVITVVVTRGSHHSETVAQ